jgi:hypothetical protein
MVKWTPFTNSVSASPMWLMQDGTVLGCTDGQTLQFLHPEHKGIIRQWKMVPGGPVRALEG